MFKKIKKFTLNTTLLAGLILAFSFNLKSEDVSSVDLSTSNPDSSIATQVQIEVNNILRLYTGEHKDNNKPPEEIRDQLEADTTKLAAVLTLALEKLEEYSEKLVDEDEQVTDTYHRLAKLLHAHLALPKIQTREQAKMITNTVNLASDHLLRLLEMPQTLDLNKIVIDLVNFSKEIEKELVNLSKNTGYESLKDRERKQALVKELESINKAVARLKNLNRPLEFLNWVQTAPDYNPAARILRWYLGVKKLEN